ncbi:NAD(P)-dependent oxidoreductase [Bacillus sp. Hm123]|uniref:NAD(P)-dependent oxidoreductase n=1 Tax=Bacillus sp. Hm123 TaxID=3450745 RepID=UPI003F4285A9
MTHKVAIIGGNGKVGRFVAKQAIENGHEVRLLARNLNKLHTVDKRIEFVKGDARNPHTIQSLLEGCEVVINTLGQPVKEFPIYSMVTKSILDTMSDLGISRYIGVTGGSLDVQGDEKSISNKMGARMFQILFPKMMQDKEREFEALQNSILDWTLIRLPFVIEGTTSYGIKESLTDMPGVKINNTDIASFIIRQIKEKEYIHKTPFIAN